MWIAKHKTSENTELKIRIVKLFFKENFKLASERTVTNRQNLFLKDTAMGGTYKSSRSNFVKEPNNNSDMKN